MANNILLVYIKYNKLFSNYIRILEIYKKNIELEVKNLYKYMIYLIKRSNGDIFLTQVYNQAYCRIGPYCVGILMAYYYIKYKDNIIIKTVSFEIYV